ncbi:ATP-binding cassette sub-family B member 6 [Chlorella vulgaris]
MQQRRAEHAALLICLNAACGIWAAVSAWKWQTARQSAWHVQRRRLAASASCVATALCSHAARLALRQLLHDAPRAGDGLPDALSCVLCLLLLLLHVTAQDGSRLWLLAAPTSSAAAVDIGAVVEAAQALRQAQHQQSGTDASWTAQHYETAALALAALSATALAASTACLLAASLAAPEAAGSGVRQPLLGEAGQQRKGQRRNGDGSRRMRLINGTLKYLVPDQLHLKIRLIACFLLLLVGRVVNIALPLAYKHLVDRLASSTAAAAAAAAAGAEGGSPSLRVLCSALAGGAAATFQEVFFPWRACRRVSLDVFAHLLRLDHAFHLHRHTGKVMRVLDRGTSSIQDVMQVMLFNIGPQVLDVAAACTFIALKLQPWTAAIVCVTVLFYIPLTFLITEYRGQVRKQMNKLDNERESKATDCLLNYETVKLFGNEGFELWGYAAAIDAFQAQEYLQLACISLLNIAQSLLVFVGLAAGLVTCVRGIVAGQLTVGDAVLFLALMAQLVAPLSFFGSYYRQIQKGMVDMEAMFELLDRQPNVQDAPDAGQLVVTQGAVAFDNVTFSYGSSAPPVLRNVSFSVPGGGRTLALVGPSGSGKSTVLRLLLRFYDPSAGCVRVDGVDVSTCSQASLRRHIAVVPQDTVLFHDTIRYNIRYGRTGASDEEVEEAARLAHIHEAIVRRFPAGYDTRVGERGLRLSGGEKQRVAFARAVLRRPAILVLDEATSALDSMTERLIQESLASQRCRQQCTTVIVAHRLSTIADADCIVVLDGGSVAEAGSHTELLQQGGLYAAMWRRQLVAGSFSQSTEVVHAAAAAAALAITCGQQQRSEATPSPSGRQLSQATTRDHSVRGEEDEAEEDEEGEEEEEEEEVVSRHRVLPPPPH